MSQHIFTYALIKAFFDQGEDYLDAFWPFVVNIFDSSNIPKTIDLIQREVVSKYNLQIPIHTIRTVLKRAKRFGFIEESSRAFSLTAEGQKYVQLLETDKEVERKIKFLMEDVLEFFETRDVETSSDDIMNDIQYIVHHNLECMSDFLNVSLPSGSPESSAVSRRKIIIDYMRHVDENSPEQYNILQDIIFGSIVAVVLNSDVYKNLNHLEEHKFKNCTVYLDSNFVFYVLGMSSREFNVPAKELLELLKKNKIGIKVFSFTVDEICGVMNGYLREQYKYPYNVKIDTLYGSLKAQGWSKQKTKEFIINIEDILRKHKIEVSYDARIDLKKYSSRNENLREAFQRRKPKSNLASQNHDLAALDNIAHIRGRSYRQLEKSKAFFLTCDKSLCKFNYIDFGHSDNGTIPETVLDSPFTNILWLKNPEAKLSLQSIIVAHSRDLFVRRAIWDKFYNTLKDLKNGGSVSLEQIASLFYNKYIENILLGMTDEEENVISADFILNEIEKATQIIEEKTKERLEESYTATKEEFEKKFEESHAATKEEFEKKLGLKLERERDATSLRIDNEWLDSIKSLKDELRIDANEKAGRMVLTTRILLTIICLLLLVRFSMRGDWEIIQTTGSIIYILAILTVNVYRGLTERVQKYITSVIYEKRVKLMKLEKLNPENQ